MGRREHEDLPDDVIESLPGGRDTREALIDFLVFWKRNHENGFIVESGIAMGKGCDDAPDFGGCCADKFDLDSLVEAIESDGLARMSIEEAVRLREHEKRAKLEADHARRYENRCPVEGCAIPGATHQGDHVGPHGKINGPPNPRRKR